MKILLYIAEKEIFELLRKKSLNLNILKKLTFLIQTLTVICVIHNTSVAESADSGSVHKAYTVLLAQFLFASPL